MFIVNPCSARDKSEVLEVRGIRSVQRFQFGSINHLVRVGDPINAIAIHTQCADDIAQL